MIKWVSISVPVGACTFVPGTGKHVFTTSFKTISIIATKDGSEAEKVRGIYQQMHDNLKSNCAAADVNPLDLLNAANTAMLTKIDAKLGPQVPGGISGFLGDFRAKMERFIKWTHADRIMNILNLWVTIHNAFFLSRNLGETLFSLIDNVIAGMGLQIKDEEGDDLDVSQWVSKQIDTTFKIIFGADNWTTAKKSWNKWNRIYQAASNIIYTVRSLGDTVLSAMEVIGSHVSSIGNAAKKAGTFFENCYPWMNTTPRFSNKWMNRYEATEQVISDLDGATSEIREVGEISQQIGQSREELMKSLKQDDGSKQAPKPPEAAKTAETESTAKVDSQSPEIPSTDL